MLILSILRTNLLFQFPFLNERPAPIFRSHGVGVRLQFLNRMFKLVAPVFVILKQVETRTGRA